MSKITIKVRESKKKEAVSRGSRDLLDDSELTQEIQSIYENELEKLIDGADEKEKPYYQSVDYVLEDYIPDKVESIQNDMYKYVSGGDYNIPGNFKQIDLDWDRDHKDGIKFSALREKLLDGVNDADTEEFSHWGIDWFFKAFGTFGLKYNFRELIWDLVYNDMAEDGVLDESRKKSEARYYTLWASFGKNNNAYYAADANGDSWNDDPDEAYEFSSRSDANKAIKSFVDTLNSGVGGHFNWTADKVFITPQFRKTESKKSEDASSVDDLLARHNQKWLVKVSYDVDASHSAVAPSIVRADTKDAATNIALKRHRGLGYNMKVVSVEPMTESRKKSEDFDMNQAFFQAKKAITDWTKRQGHKTLEWLYTDGRKSPTSYPSGIWDFEWDTGNGMATAELKVSPYETRTNSWNDSMDFSLKVGTEDKPTFYTSVEDVLYVLDTLISKTEIKMESKKSEAYSDYDAIRDWLEGVMEKAGTMFESVYVSKNRPGEICAEIEGYDSTGGDAIISLVWNAGEDFAKTISAMADELVEYAGDFDPEEEAEMYRNSGMAGVPSLRQLLKAMDERKEDMVSLAGAVSLAASKL